MNVILGCAQGDCDSDDHLELSELRRVFGLKMRKYKYEQQSDFLYDFMHGRHDESFTSDDLYCQPERLTDNGRALLQDWYTSKHDF